MLREPEELPDEQIEVWQQASEYFYRGYQRQQRGDLAGAIQDYKQSIFLYPTAEGHTFLRTALRAEPSTPRFGAARAWIEEGGWQKKRKGRASLDTTEAASRLTRRGCAAGVRRSRIGVQ